MNEQDDKLIVRLMSGEYDYDDILKLYERLNSQKDNKELKTILEWLTSQDNDLISFPSDHIIEEHKTKKRRRWSLWALAGCVVILAISLVFSLTNVTENTKTLVKFISGEAISKVELPDGTKVTLAKNSMVEYPETFNGSQRRVKLTGKAFFDVAHDESKPFFVDT